MSWENAKISVDGGGGNSFFLNFHSETWGNDPI